MLTLSVYSVNVTPVRGLNMAQVTEYHINNELIQDLHISLRVHRHIFTIVVLCYRSLDKFNVVFVIIIFYN